MYICVATVGALNMDLIVLVLYRARIRSMLELLYQFQTLSMMISIRDSPNLFVLYYCNCPN